MTYRTVCAFCVMLLSPTILHSAVLVDFYKEGTALRVRIDGTLNIEGLTLAPEQYNDAFGRFSPSGAFTIGRGFYDYGYSDQYSIDLPINRIGNGNSAIAFSNENYLGSIFGLEGYQGNIERLYLPAGYQSGGKLFGDSLIYSGFDGENGFEYFGLSPRTFVYELPNDIITVKVTDLTPVPLPASLGFGLFGIGALAVASRRKRAHQAQKPLLS